MISYFRNTDNREFRMVGLSTDTKPTEDVPNGATFVEMDTGKSYLFDAEDVTYYEVASESGGGGGGSDSDQFFPIRMTFGDSDEGVCDKTSEEIASAYNEGKIIIAHDIDASDPSDPQDFHFIPIDVLVGSNIVTFIRQGFELLQDQQGAYAAIHFSTMRYIIQGATVSTIFQQYHYPLNLN